VKIAVVGCGAVGSYYGAQLCRSGQEVHFLLRSDYHVVRRHGVWVRSPQGDFRAHPRCARTPEQIGHSDLVLIALKTTADEQFGNLLPPLAGPNTAVLTLQNGLGNEDRLARLFPKEQILGGLCFVCLNRVEPGVIHHLAHGKIVLGEFAGWPQPRTHDLASMFRAAAVPCAVTDNLARTHWEKLVWNIPFNGLGVASTAGFDAVIAGDAHYVAPHSTLRLDGKEGQGLSRHSPAPSGTTSDEVSTSLPPLPHPPPLGPCLTTDLLLADPKWSELVRALMLEVIAAARALGHHVEDSLADKQIEQTRSMGAYKASTSIDFERRQPLELESLFLEPLRQAQRAGVPSPRLAALCAILRRLNPQPTGAVEQR
jgi:2-dehydropantoate 2-reductase